MASPVRGATGLTILYLDDHLVAVDKPPGLLSVPGRGEDKADCAVSRASAEFGWIREVHRLDQATSGVLLLARNPETHRRLCAAFAARQVLKVYQSVVPALPQNPHLAGVNFTAGRDQGAGEVAIRQRKDMERLPRQLVDPENGREALTAWRQGAGFSGGVPANALSGGVVLELRPLTGRTHQLRLAMAVCGAPIYGDRLYAPAEVGDAAPRLMLHAFLIEFEHPAGRRTMKITAPGGS